MDVISRRNHGKCNKYVRKMATVNASGNEYSPLLGKLLICDVIIENRQDRDRQKM